MLTPAPIYQSLTRPLQVSGGERTYAILVIGATCLLGVMGWYFRSIACVGSALFVYTFGMLFLRRVGKKDPHMIEAARRFYGYKKFYPARSAPSYVNPAKTRGSVAFAAGFLLGIVAWLFGILTLLIPSIALIGLGMFILRNVR